MSICDWCTCTECELGCVACRGHSCQRHLSETKLCEEVVP